MTEIFICTVCKTPADDGLGDTHGCCTFCGGELKREVMPADLVSYEPEIERKYGTSNADSHRTK